MSADPQSAHEFPAEFSLEEMCWLRSDGSMDESLTTLTTLDDDAEFERQMFLIRAAREMSDLERSRSLQRQTRLFGNIVQKIIVRLFRFLLLGVDKSLGLRKNMLNQFFFLHSRRGGKH